MRNQQIIPFRPALFQPDFLHTLGVMEIGRFPNKLKYFRHSYGLSQKKVARMLGLSDTSTLSRWETGAVLPNTLHVFRLARMYGTQPEELYAELWQQVKGEVGLLAQTKEPFSSNEKEYE